MIQKDRTGGDQFETSAVADQQMNWWVTNTDGRKDRGVRPDRAQGAHGLSWQITPRVLTDALAAGGGEAKRAFEAMMTMKKIDIAAIEAARRGSAARLT